MPGGLGRQYEDFVAPILKQMGNVQDILLYPAMCIRWKDTSDEADLQGQSPLPVLGSIGIH